MAPRRPGGSSSRRLSDTPWALLVGAFLAVVFLEAVLDGGWVFALGMILSAARAGSYYLYVGGGRDDRRLNLAANALLAVGVVVLVLGLVLD